jgi:hypothetical protein
MTFVSADLLAIALCLMRTALIDWHRVQSREWRESYEQAEADYIWVHDLFSVRNAQEVLTAAHSQAGEHGEK